MSSEVPYKLRISPKAKSIKLKIDHTGLVIVSPRKLSDRKVANLLKDNAGWLSKHADRLTLLNQPKVIRDGDKLSFLGMDYVLQTQAGTAGVVEGLGYLTVPASEGSHAALVKWLKNRARIYLKQRVEQIATSHRFTFNEVRIRDQGTRWGSCSTKGNLNFSWRLAMAPLYVGDYVIIHELAHTRQMNHSRAFWDEVRSCMPNYAIAKAWLRQHGHELHSF